MTKQQFLLDLIHHVPNLLERTGEEINLKEGDYNLQAGDVTITYDTEEQQWYFYTEPTDSVYQGSTLSEAIANFKAATL